MTPVFRPGGLLTRNRDWRKTSIRSYFSRRILSHTPIHPPPTSPPSRRTVVQLSHLHVFKTVPFRLSFLRRSRSRFDLSPRPLKKIGSYPVLSSRTEEETYWWIVQVIVNFTYAEMYRKKSHLFLSRTKNKEGHHFRFRPSLTLVSDFVHFYGPK